MLISSLRKILTLTVALVAGLVLAVPAHAITATRISVTPSSASLTADQETAFQVIAVDDQGASSDLTGEAVFTTDDPRGSFSGAVYQAGKVGRWFVGVRAAGQQATVAITVTAGKLDSLAINPNSAPERVAINTSRTFSVQGYDQNNNLVEAKNVSWSVSSTLGTINSSGVFSAKQIGEGTITATSGSIKQSVAVTVTEKPVATIGETTNANGNSNSSVNTNSATNTNTTIATPNETEDTTATACSARATWVWGLVLLLLLGGSALLYAFVPVTAIWPAALSLGLAAIVSVIQYRSDCSLAWWPWVATLGCAVLAMFAYQQAPREQK